MCIYALEAVTYWLNKVSIKLVSTTPYVIWKGLEWISNTTRLGIVSLTLRDCE